MTTENNNTNKLANSSGLTDRGLVRKINEDAYLDQPEKGLWVVADGMGGHQAGDLASRMIIESLESTKLNGSLAERLDQIEDAIDQVNNELLIQGSNSNQPKKIIGSTIALLVALDHQLGAILWAGDSRVYRLRNNKLTQVSSDHSQVESYIRQGIITPEEARTHPERNIITRAVGSQEELFMEADLCEFSPKDRYLLCTDGLTRHLEDKEIADIIAKDNPDKACQALIELTLQRGAKDNVTVVIVDLS